MLIMKLVKEVYTIDIVLNALRHIVQMFSLPFLILPLMNLSIYSRGNQVSLVP
jgi:hypothetical protein